MILGGLSRRALLARAGVTAVAIAGTSPLALAHAAARDNATASAVQTLFTFDFAAGETPENIAIDRDGTIYVSLAFASTICRIAPDGTQTRVAVPTGGGIVVGVAIDHHHDGDLAVAVRSSDAGAAGIWRIARAGFGSGGSVARLAALPADSFANGMTYDHRGNLFIADSALGRVWRIASGATSATVWSADPLLQPTGATFQNFPLPGANGVKFWLNALYVSNTSTSTIVRIPVLPDGSAGKAAIRFADVQADDFAFDVFGTLYIASNPLNLLLRVTDAGTVTTLATKAKDGLDNPSAVAFGTQGLDHLAIYITNAAYFSQAPRPSVQRLFVGVPGLRLA